MDRYAQLALEEYNDAANVIRPGGVDGKNFWNLNSSQFLFPPAFQFPKIPATKEYEFSATDCTGETYRFTGVLPTESLAPIWKDLAVGMVELKVEGLHPLTGKRYLVGARTFYKAPPFPGRADLPPRARSYKEAAVMAFRYAFQDGASQYWLKHAKPDPEYYHNAYPSKMIPSVVDAMTSYAKIDPSAAEDAMKLALNAADYLLSITYGADTAVEGLPPTYSLEGLNKETVDDTAPMAAKRLDKVMLIYPPRVGIMYLELEQLTGEPKYFDAAKKIADYYKKNVLPNGSWYLLVSTATNEPEGDNCCCTFDILQFLDAYVKRTGDELCQRLAKGYFEYIVKTRLSTFNWEGQFEDIALSGNFTNLTHFIAGDFIAYLCDHIGENENDLATAKELLRFVEDQFVVWGDFAPWRRYYERWGSDWSSPAALEQYSWYVPIDSSTAKLASDFLCVYEVTKDPLLLEKACALCDSITRRQNSRNGVIPTHWMKKDCAEKLENFWINCHIFTAKVLMRLAEITGEL